jgi:hypothetical protein
LSSILRYREEDLADGDDTGRSIDSDGFGQLSSLFTGFPKITDARDPIVLRSASRSRPLELRISLELLAEERTPDGARRLLPPQPELFAEATLVPALVLDGSSIHRVVPLDLLRRIAQRRYYGDNYPEEPKFPCVAVSPYGGESTSNLGVLWDKIALSDREKDVVNALRIIAPDIVGVSMVGGEGSRRIRTAIVRSRNFARPVPLRSFGDGLNRLFGIILSLVNAKGGILVIDEFENGMHHTVQYDVWRGIFRLARQLDVQIFATSHSWDAVQAFQQAAAESAEDGVLVRLSRRDDEIFPTVFRESELAVVSRDHIEVR